MSKVKGSLFAKAVEKAPSKKSAKDEKIRINIEDPSFFEKVQELESLNDTISCSKAKADVISDELREISKVEWSRLYDINGKNPETVMICQDKNGDTAQFMFIVQDKYISIDENRAEVLKETYGDEIVQEEKSFGFNDKMIEKYGEILSRLIEECEEIDDDDREKIITANVKYSIAKGTIDNLNKYGEVESVVNNIKPIMNMRGVEIVKK